MTIWVSTTNRRERVVLSAALRRECRIVVRVVSAATGVPYRDFFAPSRKQVRVAAARQLAMYLCNVLLGMTMTQVGCFFGRDRTTVAYACSQIEDSRDEGSPEDFRITALEKRIERARSRIHPFPQSPIVAGVLHVGR